MHNVLTIPLDRQRQLLRVLSAFMGDNDSSFQFTQHCFRFTIHFSLPAIVISKNGSVLVEFEQRIADGGAIHEIFPVKS